MSEERWPTHVPQAGNVAQAPPAAAESAEGSSTASSCSPGDSASVEGRRRRCRSSTQRPRRPRWVPPTSVPSTSVPGVRAARTAAAATGRMPSRRRGSGSASSSGSRSEGGEAGGDQHRRELLVAVGRGVEPVGPEQQRRCGVELRAEDVAEGDGPAAVLDDGDGLGGRQPARPLAGDLLERLRDRPDGAEVGAGADHDGHACSRRRRTRLGEVAHRRGRQHAVGDVVGADEDDGEVGVGAEGGVDLLGQRAGLRPTTANERRCTRRSACAATPVARCAPVVSSTRSTP